MNRVDIGLFAFEKRDDLLCAEGDIFSYDDTIAIAALLNQGFSPNYAAALVAHKMVYASAYYAGSQGDYPIDLCKPAMHCGYYRLPDGSLWSVDADMDAMCTEPSDLQGDFLLVATRGTAIVDESPAERVRHMLTKCDKLGRPEEKL